MGPRHGLVGRRRPRVANQPGEAGAELPSGSSVPDQTPATVGRSWVVIDASVGAGHVAGGASSNQATR